MEYPKVILGKDTVADKKYLEVHDERIAQVEYNQLPERDKLVLKKAELEAKITAIDAK